MHAQLQYIYFTYYEFIHMYYVSLNIIPEVLNVRMNYQQYFVCFLECQIHLCDFHREKAWNEWLSKIDHGVSNRKDEVLGFLRTIATSASKLDLEKNTLAFKNSEIWKQSPSLQEYYTVYWETHIEVYSNCVQDKM